MLWFMGSQRIEGRTEQEQCARHCAKGWGLKRDKGQSMPSRSLQMRGWCIDMGFEGAFWEKYLENKRESKPIWHLW